MQRTSGQLMGKFLSYYRGQVGLFVADIICSLAVTGIDLALSLIHISCAARSASEVARLGLLVPGCAGEKPGRGS